MIVVGTAVVALPLLIYLFYGQISNHFFKWYPGWLANEYNVDWLTFWWRNWGITPVTTLVGWVWLIREKVFNQRTTTKRTLEQKSGAFLAWSILPFIFLFILLNLFLFQPFSWDNTKLLAWASAGSSGLVAYLIVQIWSVKIGFMHKLDPRLRGDDNRNSNFVILFRSICLAGGTLVFMAITLSGAIDAYRCLLFPLHSYVMYSTDDLSLARWVEQNTSVNSIWLTSNQHNHWLYDLTGRQSIMTYPGWLWTYGYSYLPVQDDVETMYRNPSLSKQLLAKYKVDYVVIGTFERTVMHPDEEFFNQNFPVIFELEETKIYRVN